MKDDKSEALSALIDGESEHQDRDIKRLLGDSDLKTQWAEHYRTKSMMHGEYTGVLDDDFASRVSEALESEPAILAPKMVALNKSEKPSHRYVPAVGFAIAATVAAVSIFGLNNFSGSSQYSAPALAGLSGSAQPAAAQVMTPTAEVRRVSLANDGDGTHWYLQRVDNERDPELEARLNMYLADHMEYANAGKVQGVVPYSRLVGYDTKD